VPSHRIILSAVALFFGVAATVGATLPPQLVDLWSPRTGWQVLQDHPAAPELLLIGIIGVPYHPQRASFPVPLPPAGTRPRVPVGYGSSGGGTVPGAADLAAMPRLTLRCENGVTGLQIERPLAPPNRWPLSPRGGRRPTAAAGAVAQVEGKLVLDFGAGEPIQVDLRDYSHRAAPVLLPDPFDNIGRLRRNEELLYYEIEAGDPVIVDFANKRASAVPDAVFPLEGLDELLRAHRDPCGWRAS